VFKVVLDEAGRVKIPKEILDELSLRPGQVLVLEISHEGLLLKPSVGVDEFISELRGCVKSSKVKPAELKHIWRMRG